MKIIDKIHENLERDNFFYSFEYFPPKTDAGCVNLYERMERMKDLNPCFVGVTWGCEGSTSAETLEICSSAQNLLGLEALMHITCTNTPLALLQESLAKARDSGVQNLFVLRGASASSESEFKHAVDFVRWVRKEHGDYFGIAVAGYPEGHDEAESYEKDLQYLKEKVDAGADLVISQLFYDEEIFMQFVHDCRKIGIKCPIIPGIMPINTRHQFQRTKKFCKRQTQAVKELAEKVSSKLDDDEVKDLGVREVARMIKKLMRRGVRGFHFFTQNLEKSVMRVLTDAPPDGLGLLGDEEPKGGDFPCHFPETRRDLPWRKSANMRRCGEEEIRPAFWANRPKSYMARTISWDDFPNDRWGDSRSPAFGEVDHHLFPSHTRQWLYATTTPFAANSTLNDICLLFLQSLTRTDTQLLPWFESSLSSESHRILPSLLQPMNTHALLSINSQPGVNGEPSDTKDVGWGPKGGYVYQKAYVEFFCSPDAADQVFDVIAQPKYAALTYMASSLNGFKANHEGVTAVTWGVFPGKEIIQPTVVDTASFMEWKKE
eukprot:gene1947-2957_t